MTKEARMWAILGILVTLLTAMPPIIATRAERATPATQQHVVELGTTGPLDPLRDLAPLASSSPLRLVLAGRTLQNLTIWQVTLHNTGETAIKPQDFVERLRIHVQEPWEIVSINDEHLPAEVTLHWSRTGKNTMEAAPFLLNPGDYVLQTVYLTTNEDPARLDKKTSFPSFSLRVPNLKHLTPAKDPWENLSRKTAIVYLSFQDVLALLTVSSVFLLWYIFLLRKTGAYDLRLWRVRGALLLAAVLSVSVAEVVIYYAFGGDPTNEYLRKVHLGGGIEWQNWIVLALHVTASVALLLRARRTHSDA